MNRTAFCGLAAIVLSAVLAGCATTTPTVKASLAEADKVAWAVKGADEEFTVAVSPAGGTIKMVPRVGKVVGTTVDLVINDRYRIAIREALGDYSLPDVFLSRLEARLAKVVAAGSLTAVSSLDSTAGFHSTQDAQAARLTGLGKEGTEVLLDLDVQYGIYGAECEMRLTLGGKVVTVPGGRTLWRGKIPITVGPFLANLKFKNPLLSQVAYFNKPRLSVDKDAATEMTQDDAVALREQFETAVDAGISALLCDMGLIEEGLGQYYLARHDFQKKRFDKAQERFERAMELTNNRTDVLNDLAVTCDRQGQPDKAIRLALQILEQRPEYGPALFNLAWWFAFEKENWVEARRYYEQALEAGMAPSNKLEKGLEGPREE